MTINKPIFFEPNRVSRVYTGGKLFADFFGDNSEDGYFPEEWIASSVEALKGKDLSSNNGLSKVKGTDILFKDLLENNKKDMIGDCNELGFLTKILDSSIRLPVQAHPDKAFSRKYFNSEYGKAECWIVLDTRPNAKLYFGFKDGVIKEDFIAAIEKSETDKTAMVSLVKEIPVQKGDVFFIPPKEVHAIGAGCLILEILEPTDFTVEPEAWCGDYRLNDEEMFCGLPFDVAMECFNFGTDCNPKRQPKIIEETDEYVYEELIGKTDTDCFGVNRIKLNNGKFTLRAAPGVYVVTEGSGTIGGKIIKKGDYFFHPYCLDGKCIVSTDLSIELVECFKKN